MRWGKGKCEATCVGLWVELLLFCFCEAVAFLSSVFSTVICCLHCRHRVAGNYLLPHCVNFPTWIGRLLRQHNPQRGKKRNELLQVQVIQRAADLAKGLGAYVGVDLGGFAGTVPQQGLDVAKIRALLKEMRGKAVA